LVDDDRSTGEQAAERLVRARVAGALEDLNLPGQDLSVDSARSTLRLHGDGAARMKVWEDIRDEYLARHPKVDVDGRAIVLSAGAPGAGKSTAISETIGDDSRWRRIDPDVIKEMLIERELASGTYDDLLARKLDDGRPIMPLELSSLVHRESVELASYLRDRSMRAGENLIIEGTLAWDGMPRVHADEVLRHGYDHVAVVAVTVSRGVALERTLQRWWRRRCDPAAALGGRFVPRSVVLGCYLDESTTTCEANALELVRLLDYKPGLEVFLHSVDGSVGVNEAGNEADRAIRRVGD